MHVDIGCDDMQPLARGQARKLAQTKVKFRGTI